jgi:hypothetical protein
MATERDKEFPDTTAGRLWLNSIRRIRSAEVELSNVIRWKKYIPLVQCRKQNSLGHSYTITLLGSHFAILLKPYVLLDANLLITALLTHDLGEMLRSKKGEDILWHNKNANADLEEYNTFLAYFKDMKPTVLREYERAFLLQFAKKDVSCFPDRAKKIMAGLRKEHPSEIAAFQAIEYWEYVLYGLAHYEETKNPLLLLKVLYDHFPIMDRISKELPGFKEEVWTEDIRRWCEKFIVENPKALKTVKDTMYL